MNNKILFSNNLIKINFNSQITNFYKRNLLKENKQKILILKIKMHIVNLKIILAILNKHKILFKKITNFSFILITIL